MLLRTVTLAFCTLALSHATAHSLERRLIGQWVAEGQSAPALTLYLTFRPDHTLVSHYGDGRRLKPAVWRVSGDRLIQRWSIGSMQRVDVSKPVFRGDRLSFGVHEARNRERGGAWTRQERWVEAVTFRRCR